LLIVEMLDAKGAAITVNWCKANRDLRAARWATPATVALRPGRRRERGGATAARHVCLFRALEQVLVELFIAVSRCSTL
jgi:hypothetical protein